MMIGRIEGVEFEEEAEEVGEEEGTGGSST